jgi:hypothetical protein
MKWNYSNMNNSQTANVSEHGSPFEINNITAYHLAGHAVAICIGNKRKQLPAVHFQIIKKPQNQEKQQANGFARMQGKCSAKIEGGRLIQSLPMSYAEATQGLPSSHQKESLSAFEADIINLLAGWLAEAKFVAAHDGEVFTPNIVNLAALKFYTGTSDLEIINEYMDCFMLCEAARGQKLADLFFAAFGFVNKPSNWQAISALAEFIQNEPKDIIHCEDVITFLDTHFVDETGSYLALMPSCI